MSSPIGRGEFTRALRERFALTGRYEAGLEASVLPIAILEDLTRAPSVSYRRAAYGDSIAALAGNITFVGIAVPAASGVLVVVRRCYVSSGNGIEIWGIGSSDVGYGAGTAAADYYDSAVSTSSAVRTLSVQQAAVAVNTRTLVAMGSLNGEVVEGPRDVILRPNSHFVMHHSVVNADFRAWLEWDEYSL